MGMPSIWNSTPATPALSLPAAVAVSVSVPVSPAARFAGAVNVAVGWFIGGGFPGGASPPDDPPPQAAASTAAIHAAKALRPIAMVVDIRMGAPVGARAELHDRRRTGKQL